MIFTDPLRRDRIRNEKSASRPESADLPHSAQSLFPRINPAWAVRRAVLPWVREPVDSATAYVRNGIASEAHVRNGGATSRKRPYGGKFIRHRRSWKRGRSARHEVPATGSKIFSLLLLPAGSRRHGTCADRCPSGDRKSVGLKTSCAPSMRLDIGANTQ